MTKKYTASKAYAGPPPPGITQGVVNFNPPPFRPKKCKEKRDQTLQEASFELAQKAGMK